jgi:hypothetical protein
MLQSMSSRFNEEIQLHDQSIARRIGRIETFPDRLDSVEMTLTGHRTSDGQPIWLKTDCLPDELRQAITRSSATEVMLMLCDGNLLLPELNTLLLQTSHAFAGNSGRSDICTAISSLWGTFDKCNMKKSHSSFFRFSTKEGDKEKPWNDRLIASLREWISIVEAIMKNDSALFSKRLTADFTRTQIPAELAVNLFSIAAYYVADTVVISIMGNFPRSITTSMLQKYPALIEKIQKSVE